jgi:hypothetical protein
MFNKKIPLYLLGSGWAGLYKSDAATLGKYGGIINNTPNQFIANKI